MMKKTNTIYKIFGNNENLRQQQLELISLLNRWYQVKEDLIYAFEKAATSEIKNPMKLYLNEFIARIKGGITIDQSLEMLKISVSDERFDTFINQIKFNMKYRGNTGELLENLETQFLRIEQEREKRKISSGKDRKYILILFILSPLIFILFLIGKETFKDLFINSVVGNIMIGFGILSYFSGIMFFKVSSKFKE